MWFWTLKLQRRPLRYPYYVQLPLWLFVIYFLQNKKTVHVFAFKISSILKKKVFSTKQQKTYRLTGKSFIRIKQFDCYFAEYLSGHFFCVWLIRNLKKIFLTQYHLRNVDYSSQLNFGYLILDWKMKLLFLWKSAVFWPKKFDKWIKEKTT